MEGKLSRAQQEAKAYVELHNLEKLVGEMLNTLVHEKDPKPKIFMIKYLAGQVPQEQLEESGIKISGPFPKPRALVRYPQFTEDCNSLLKKYLNREIWDKYRDLKTNLQGEFYTCIYPGVENQEHPIGIVAVDEQAFSIYEKLFTPILTDLHSGNSNFQSKWDEVLVNQSSLIQNVRIAVARNFKNYSFAPNLNPTKRKEIEETAVQELMKIKNGKHHQIGNINEQIKEEFKDLIFNQGDKYQESIGVNSEWPYSRGLWISDDKTIIAQINAEDHLTLISQGASIQESFNNLYQTIKNIKIEWAKAEGWGYATVNINKLGPAMTISLYLKDDLKVVNQQQVVSKWASSNGFQFYGGQKKIVVATSKVNLTESAFVNKIITALQQLETTEQSMRGKEASQMDLEQQKNQQNSDEVMQSGQHMEIEEQKSERSQQEKDIQDQEADLQQKEYENQMSEENFKDQQENSPRNEENRSDND